MSARRLCYITYCFRSHSKSTPLSKFVETPLLDDTLYHFFVKSLLSCHLLRRWKRLESQFQLLPSLILAHIYTCVNPFRAKLHKMVKHTQTIRRLFPKNCLSVFDHFVGSTFKGLTSYTGKKEKIVPAKLVFNQQF